MVHDVWVFGDSHWRVFFPFVNHKVTDFDNRVEHEQDGIRTIDTIGNGLSGSTMYGLLNDNSRHHARRTILETLDRLGGVENVGLVFGEVDARYHHDKYCPGGYLSSGRVLETLSRYIRFIDEDLLRTGRVRKNVFVYHGFTYPQCADTLLQPGQPIGDNGWRRAEVVNMAINNWMPTLMDRGNVHCITHLPSARTVSADGVHLVPEQIYPIILDRMRREFGLTNWEIPF